MRIADFALERYFAAHEFSVAHNLASSTLETLQLGELLALADGEGREMGEALRLGYTETRGHPRLRQAIAGLCEGVEPDDVLVFSGAQEAVFTVAHATLGPGDHAVVVWPAYQSLHEVPRAAGADVSLLELREDEGWQLDVERMRRALTPRTRLIAVNFPHNPTGAHLRQAAFEEVVALAEEAGATLLSDEVYRFSEHDPLERLPAAASLSRRAASVGVMSKSFGLAGLRIGWVASRDRDLLARCARLKDYLSICSAGPSEVLALIALRARDAILARNLEIVRANVALLDGFFDRRAGRFAWVRPRAGAVGFPRFEGGNVEDLTARLRREQDVLILPGAVFGCGAHFRIGFGSTGFREGLARLEVFVGRHGE